MELFSILYLIIIVIRMEIGKYGPAFYSFKNLAALLWRNRHKLHTTLSFNFSPIINVDI